MTLPSIPPPRAMRNASVQYYIDVTPTVSVPPAPARTLTTNASAVQARVFVERQLAGCCPFCGRPSPDRPVCPVCAPNYSLLDDSYPRAWKRRRSLAPHDRHLLLKVCRFRCLSCGARDNLHHDHVVPFSKGGADTLDNAQVLCRSCNISKGNRSSIDYRTSSMRAQLGAAEVTGERP